MKNKGYSLVELLAVITILGLLILITVPIINNSIIKSKQKALENQKKELIRTTKKYAIKKSSILPFAINDISEVSVSELLKEEIIDDSKVINPVTEEIMTGCVTITFGKNDKDYKYNYIDTCQNTTLKKYENGTQILFNPVTGTKCTDYVAANSLNETSTGCMKWYTFNDSERNSNVNMILDHNTTKVVAHNSTGGKEPLEVKTALETKTSTWKNEYKPRILSAFEIANIIGVQDFKNDYLSKCLYSFENPINDLDRLPAGTAKYKWLFDYTTKCREFGCSNEDATVQGYWTNTIFEIEDIGQYSGWITFFGGGMICEGYVSFPNGPGVRPVITVSKSLIN
ncbi:MAG: prepilin-type N-terminal cleavage/methylation domain-containing protein [Bacilli bacterium]